MYRIVPRESYGLPKVVTGSDNRPRPPLHNEKWMTAHYTGNNVDYTEKVTEDVILQIQAVFDDTKPFEYNYVIGQEENREIYEFAGKFQAAHSAGENADSFGVLFLLGVGERLTATMINKWRWLRETLIFDGSLSLTCIQLPHKMMPGAATACPGIPVMDDWTLLLQPYEPEREEVLVNYVKHKNNPAEYAQYSNGTKVWIKDGGTKSVYQFLKPGPTNTMPDDNWMNATGAIVGPIPPGVDGFGVPLK